MPDSLYKEEAPASTRLLSPQELKKQLPLTLSQATFIADSRQMGRDLLSGKEKRILIIAGPCSIHDRETALEYARRFKELSEKVEKSSFLLMRVYVEKPRTTVGWKGLLYDPHLDGSHDIATGLYWSRQLLLDLANLQIPVATEFVDPLTSAYLEDLISWGVIGARTSASQTHRQLASSLDFPVGFKNGVDGNLDNAINGVVAAAAPHSYLSINQEGEITIAKSRGNPYGHVVLRGSVDETNYDRASIEQVVKKLRFSQHFPRILIDCAHGNCQRKYEKQEDAFHSIITQIAEGNRHILGAMLESHLKAGNQSFPYFPLRNDISITDPCIDWATTEKMILWAHSSALSI